jgi:hypothetical protein
MGDVLSRFETLEELTDCPFAARLNGYVAQWGTPEGLKADLPALELSEGGSAHLRSLYC